MKLKIKYLLILGILIFQPFYTNGNPVQSDSILKLLSSVDDSIKIVLLSQLTGEYKTSSLEKCLEYENQSLFIAELSNRTDWMAKAYLRIGKLYHNTEMYSEAINEYVKAQSLAEQIRDSILIGYIYHELGKSYLNNGQTQESLSSFKQANHIAKLKKDTLSQILNYISIAELFLSLDNNEEALIYLHQCIPCIQDVRNYKYYVKILLYITKIEINAKNFTAARENLTQASVLAQEAGLNYETANILYYLGLNFTGEDNVNLGMQHFNLALELANKYHFTDLIIKNEQELSVLLENNGNFAQALSYQKHIYQLKDSLRIQHRNQKMSFLDMKYDSEKKEKDIVLLKKEDAIQDASLSKQKRLRFYFLFVCIILIVGAGFSIRANFIKQRMTSILNQKKKLLEKTQEDLLKAKQKLQNLDDTKNKLFSIMAHDLINPFNALLGFASLLEEESNHLNKNEIKEYSAVIHQTANNLYSLLENLLQWSQSQTGKIITRKEMINISELVKSVVNLFQVMVDKKEITINSSVDKNCLAFADYDLISAAVRNLVQNAIKFSPSGSKIHLSVSCKRGKAIIVIADEGIGIQKEDQEKLFRPDEHISTQGTSNETGAGLGLIIAQEFIILNEGLIDLESSPGVGSTFTITLPGSDKSIK
ncbi:MAG: tetratricopeptide repeat-containing sensor histidine kinase [Bacteroidota bacterium]|nr:tetratricopeptide repeat-containing sensor histidine kinase [Bacteroidota bacterium]